ncbi:MAG TPA: AAA family ATPase [Mariprofundaceae bacterium]|nr:AAA family ATPase [Mariprofundaceae bacterium]
MKVLASYNIKGGVGKTSTAVNLAYLAARSGARTLIWDLDPQAAAGYCLRVKPGVKGGGRKLLHKKSASGRAIKGSDYENLDLLPADFSYRHFDLELHDAKHSKQRLNRVLEPLRNDYDFIFLDCPPGISLLSEAVFRTADALVIPTLPSILSLRTLQQLLAFRKEKGLRKLLPLAFLTMVDRRKKLHNQIVGSRDRMGSWMLESVVPYASEVEQMAERREPVCRFLPNGRAAAAYVDLWDEIQDRIF